jgi:beta-N-acetylhexosaminidase
VGSFTVVPARFRSVRKCANLPQAIMGICAGADRVRRPNCRSSRPRHILVCAGASLVAWLTAADAGPEPATAANPRLEQARGEQHVDALLARLTLDQKLAQMMIVQFPGPAYSPAIDAMIRRNQVGAVVLYAKNGNIQDRTQLASLILRLQAASALPLLIAIDQEGGTVDRLASLNGRRAAAAAIGATGDPYFAQKAGEQDAADLASFGFNLNLAPVVDVTNVPNRQLRGRTYGDNPEIVTCMAAAYLQGLQQSGKVLGTLKHFPGLGSVGADPHDGVADVSRARELLEAVDWAPYRALIAQGGVHAVMVTHELVRSVDPDTPSSLSRKLVTDVLRAAMGFRGVVITDSLTMDGVTAFATSAQSAPLAVLAGDDLLMGASSPQEVAAMIEAIKTVVRSHAIGISRINDSVKRILWLKFRLGLLDRRTAPRGLK